MGKGIWKSEPPASDEAIQNLLKDSGLDLPRAYLNYLRENNGGEGDLSISPLWLQLWKAEKVVEHNKDYEVQEYMPNFFAFASSGGGVMIAFKAKEPDQWSIYEADFCALEEDNAIMIAKDFEEFSKAIGQEFEEGLKSSTTSQRKTK